MYLRGSEVVQAARLEGRQPVVATIRQNALTDQITPAWRMRDKRTGDIYEISGKVPTDDRLYYEVTAIRTKLGQVGVVTGTVLEIGTPVQTFFRDMAEPGFAANLVADTKTKLNLDPAFVASNEPADYASHDFFEGGDFQPIGNAIGGQYEIRLTFDVVPSLINANLSIEVDIGGTIGRIDGRNVALTADAGETERVTVQFDVYVGATFLANGAGIYVTPSQNVALSNAAVKVTVERVS